MLHKGFLFVSLLAPSMSFASTATESLSGATRDLFDRVRENPAAVNDRGDKSSLRLGKEAGLQLITNAAGYGLGIRAGASQELAVVTGSYSVEGAPENFAATTTILRKTAEELARDGLPFVLTLGSTSGDIKWGLELGYQSIKRNEEVITDTRDSDGKLLATYTAYYPTYSSGGLSAGMIMGDLEATLSWAKGDWKLGTSQSTHDGNTATADKRTVYLEDAVSAQSTTYYNLLTRYQTEGAQWFLDYTQQVSDLKLWDRNDAQTGGTQYDAKDARKAMRLALGGERNDTLSEGIKLYSKSWLTYLKFTDNDIKTLSEATDTSVSSAHGVEVEAASWVALRAGFQASIVGVTESKETVYETAGRKGKSESNTEKSTYVMRSLSSPTMGVGFKFGNYMVDATLAQDGTGNLGFTEKILGKVEVTAKF